MNVRFFVGCFFLCAAVLTLGVSAAGHTDEMSSVNNADFKLYNNLAVQSFRGSASLPDPTALTFANITKPAGSAVYIASGVETVKAAIYTHVGTLVTRQPVDGSYMLGVFQSNISEIMPNGPLQALYCTQTGGIYTESGGLKQAAMDLTGYRFVPVITPPQGETIGYGVNIYYSLDGSRFTRTPMTGLSYNYDPNLAFCYEEYSAAVPQSAKMIKVEINDAYEVPLTSGGTTKKESRYMTSVASVTLSGGNLSLGPEKSSVEPPPDTSDPLTSSSSPDSIVSNSAEEYAERKSSSEKDSGYEDKYEDEYEDEKSEYINAVKKEDSVPEEPSSKFSGTITSSSKERSSSSGQSQTQSKFSSLSGGSSSAASVENEAPEQIQTYRIDRDQEDSGFNGAVIAYIIVVSAAIFLVIVLPRK